MLSDHFWGTEQDSAKERSPPFGFPRFLFSSPALWSLLSVICGNSKACTVTISFFQPPPSTVKTHFLISKILWAPHGRMWDMAFPRKHSRQLSLGLTAGVGRGTRTLQSPRPRAVKSGFEAAGALVI